MLLVSTKINEMLSKYGVGNNIVTDINLVNNEDSAIRMAEVVLVPIYGESVDSKKPFKAKYDCEYEVWVVSGTLGKKFLGGVPNVIIQKSDGKVLAVWHSK